MTARREFFLDTLLVGLVIASIFLSSKVWTDPTRYNSVQTDRPRVQSQPYVPEWTMPDIYRPTRVTVTLPDGTGAFGGPDSAVYSRVWRVVHPLLRSLRPIGIPRTVDDVDFEAWKELPSISLVLPVLAPFAEWGDRWGWNTFGLRSEVHLRIDRVILFLGDPGGMVFAGPTGNWQMIYLREPDLQALTELVHGLDASHLHEFAPLPADKAERETWVPSPGTIPLLELEVLQPDRVAVLNRFFPDLSVVRQIEENRSKSDDVDLNATSYTDGQKLIRIYNYGAIEYYSPDRSAGTAAPSFTQALTMAQDFVAAHGGWPQDIALTHWETIGNRVVLTFDLQKGVSGVPPLVSRHGYLSVGVTADRVVYLLREPSVRVMPTGPRRALTSVQDALGTLSEERPWTKFEKVRDVSLVYLSLSGHQQQMAEPYWVISLTWGPPYFIQALSLRESDGKRILPDLPIRP